MNGLGDHLLAGPALALNQHGGARRRHLGHQVEHREHFFALADDVREIVALLERALELDVFFAEAAALDGQRNLGEQLVVRPWLGDVILRAVFEGSPRHVDRAIRGDQNDGEMRIAVVDFAEQFNAVAIGKADVEQQQVEGLIVELRNPASPVSATDTS